MDYDILKSVSQGSDGAQDAENSRIEAISDELKRRCKLYEAQLGDGQPHVGPFEIEQRITESSAKEHGLWIPIDSVFDLGTPGRSSLTHFSIDALDDFMGRSPLTQVDYLTVFKPRFSFTASKARRHYVHVMHKITP